MQIVEVFDLEGRQLAASPEQLRLALSRRFEGGNHFEIAPSGSTYPNAHLMVNGDLAVVHYFPAKNNAGAQSIGELVHAAETVDFPENRSGAIFTMPGSAVVRATTAMLCAVEFGIDLQRPTAISWLEL